MGKMMIKIISIAIMMCLVLLSNGAAESASNRVIDVRKIEKPELTEVTEVTRASCNVSDPSISNCTIGNGTDGAPPVSKGSGSPPPVSKGSGSPPPVSKGGGGPPPVTNGSDGAPPDYLSPPASAPTPTPVGFLYAPVPAPDFHDFYGGYKFGSIESSSKAPLLIGLPLAATIVVMLLAICWYCRRKKSSNKHKDKPNLDSIIIKEHGFLAPKRYNYAQIKKMTNSFRNKLGEGGFGEVYKGTLIDGDHERPVAVKILKSTKAYGEDFVNEVVNISRTSHVNIVSLLGFCIHKRKRALVYEFMENGSLEKYIYKESMAKSSIAHLGWERLYQISLGVARGLEYLHRGCNTRILHFDIKPHNILLDQDFVPKISDFGLAKQCTTKESVISMMETRGTIGYIAPEVISRNFGGVSHKSDVYSYGMMLLEMVGGRKNICPLVSQTSEIYFPHWIYQRIIVRGDLKLQGVTTIEENEMAEKMIIVGLWCIQNDPMQRPGMRKVIEMLEGSLESMEIPPKPFFGSPSRTKANSSDAEQEITSIS